MTHSNWQDSNKFKEQKPLHARIIKFIDGKVFLCCFIWVFFLFSKLHSTPLLEINQQKKKNVPAKFCRHQIPIYIPTKSNNSENSSLNFVPNLFFMMFELVWTYKTKNVCMNNPFLGTEAYAFIFLKNWTFKKGRRKGVRPLWEQLWHMKVK